MLNGISQLDVTKWVAWFGLATACAIGGREPTIEFLGLSIGAFDHL